MKIIISDLDGCLFDDAWRLPLIKVGQPTIAQNYEDYHKALVADCVLEKNVLILKDLFHNTKEMLSEDVQIHFCTARPASVEAETQDKILAHMPWAGKFGLHMRPAHKEGTSSVDLKRSMLQFILRETGLKPGDVIAAFDDREDVVRMYREEGVLAHIMGYDGLLHQSLSAEAKVTAGVRHEPAKITHNTNWRAPTFPFLVSAPEHFNCKIDLRADLRNHDHKLAVEKATADKVLAAAAETFKERNAVYKDNAVVVGKLMEVLFPEGVVLKTDQDFLEWHLFELVIIKLTRFVASERQHKDSARDSAVYWAMLEAAIENNTGKTTCAN